MDNNEVLFDQVDTLLEEAHQKSQSMLKVEGSMVGKVDPIRFFAYARQVREQIDVECALVNLKWSARKIGGMVFV